MSRVKLMLQTNGVALVMRRFSKVTGSVTSLSNQLRRVFTWPPEMPSFWVGRVRAITNWSDRPSPMLLGASPPPGRGL
jgi:hypothetical protein